MRKLLCLSVLLGVLALAGPAFAASILLDFDPPNFSADTSAGDFSHVFATPYGNVFFNGRIFNKLDSSVVADHTTGDGNFLKNSVAASLVEIIFDFDVRGIDFYWYGIDGETLNGAIFDIDGIFLDGGDTQGVEEWENVSVGDFSKPIRKLSLWSLDDSGSLTGNLAAVDDLTLYLYDEPVVPEPASMILMGIGLAGAGIARARKRG